MRGIDRLTSMLGAGLSALMYADPYFDAPNPSGRWMRWRRRQAKQSNYHANGLNGPRAMARRARQAERSAIKGEIADLTMQISGMPCWGAAITAMDEQRRNLRRQLSAV